MCEFATYVVFNKATNGNTDIKHDKEKKKTLFWMSLLNIAVEKLPPAAKLAVISVFDLFRNVNTVLVS